MPIPTEVIVRSDTVDFPATCVVCLKTLKRDYSAATDHSSMVDFVENVTLRANSSGLFGLIPWIFGATKKLRVPACRKCGVKLRRAILIRNLTFLIAVLVVSYIAVSIGFFRWQSITLLIAVMVVPAIWNVLRPLPFEFTHQQGQFTLTFRDVTLAYMVSEMNGGEMDVKIVADPDQERDVDKDNSPAASDRDDSFR